MKPRIYNLETVEKEVFETFAGGALWATLVIAVATLPEWIQWCIELGKSL